MGLKFFSRKNKEHDLKVKLTSSTKPQLDLAKALEKNKEKANTDTFQRNLQNEIKITQSLIKSANDLINDSMDIDVVNKLSKYKGKLQDQLVYLSKADRANKVSLYELTNKIKTIQENDPKKRIKELGASTKDFAMESAHVAGMVFGFMKPLLGILGYGFEKFLNKFPPMEFKQDDGYINKLLKNVFNGMRRIMVQLGNIFGGEFDDNSSNEDFDTLKDSLTKQKESLVDRKNLLEFDEHYYKTILEVNNIDWNGDKYIENVKKLSKATNEIKNKIKEIKLGDIKIDNRFKKDIKSRFHGNESITDMLRDKISLLDLIDTHIVSLDENNKVNILDKKLVDNKSFNELVKLKYLEYLLDRNIFYIMSQYDKTYANVASSDETIAKSHLMDTGFKNIDTFEFNNVESYYDEINSSTSNDQIASIIHINNMDNIFLNRQHIKEDSISDNVFQIKKNSTNNKITYDQSVIKDYELKLKSVQSELNTIHNDIQSTDNQINHVEQQITTRNAKTTIEKKETIVKTLDSVDKDFYEVDNSNAKINIHLNEFMNSLAEDIKFESTTDYNDYDLYSTSDKRQGDKL